MNYVLRYDDNNIANTPSSHTSIQVCIARVDNHQIWFPFKLYRTSLFFVLFSFLCSFVCYHCVQIVYILYIIESIIIKCLALQWQILHASCVCVYQFSFLLFIMIWWCFHFCFITNSFGSCSLSLSFRDASLDIWGEVGIRSRVTVDCVVFPCTSWGELFILFDHLCRFK